ncbi:uncharacterized protein LOC135711003, partial [Ochlerotatus camptorhynchus]|uniref:uncharacterized protein LOC135711003 n=1 Tax=Ochlerotatus camptorhynchus TaxID=644619 RepID=UPI0031DE9905
MDKTSPRFDNNRLALNSSSNGNATNHYPAECSARAATVISEAEEEEDVEVTATNVSGECHPRPDFKPINEQPEEIEVKTGQEDEEQIKPTDYLRRRPEVETLKDVASDTQEVKKRKEVEREKRAKLDRKLEVCSNTFCSSINLSESIVQHSLVQRFGEVPYCDVFQYPEEEKSCDNSAESYVQSVDNDDKVGETDDEFRSLSTGSEDAPVEPENEASSARQGEPRQQRQRTLPKWHDDYE